MSLTKAVTPLAPPSLHTPRATSVLTQGKLVTASKMLFLLLKSSDIDIDSRVVYALPSPFVHNDTFLISRTSFADLTATYLVELRGRQPYGPYWLGR